MSTRVEIAIVGVDVRSQLPIGPNTWDLGPYEEGDDSRPWEERRRVTIAVEDDESLASILDRAAQELDVFENDDWNLGYGTGRFVALRDDASPVPLTHRLVRFVTLVDDDGRAIWGVTDFEDVSYGQIRAAAEAGALVGDPTKIYFHVSLVPAGGWVPWEWELLVQAWEVAWKTVVMLVAANETHELYRKIRDRLAGRDVVARNACEWLERNGMAEYMEGMLRGDPWSARDLAGLLGCTATEAEAVLSLYGYEESPEPGIWVYAAGAPGWGIPATDLAARLLVAYRREVASRHPDTRSVPEQELVALFEAMLKAALDEGEVSSRRYGGVEGSAQRDRDLPADHDRHNAP